VHTGVQPVRLVWHALELNSPRLQYSCSKKPQPDSWASSTQHVYPAKSPFSRVGPTRLELVTSAMRRRSEGFVVVHYRSKNRLNKPNPEIFPSWLFVIVRAGCRQTVVSCIRKYCASKEASFRDPHVYSTPVHVVLGASVQEARERESGKQQVGSMQAAEYGFPRIHLPRLFGK
jgi:hypothetical protein